MKYLNYFDRHNDREDYIANADLEKSVYIQFCDDKKHVHFLDNQIETIDILHNGTASQYNLLNYIISNYVDYYNIPEEDLENYNTSWYFNSDKAEYHVYLQQAPGIVLNDNIWNKIVCFNNNNFDIYGDGGNVSLLSLESSSFTNQSSLSTNNDNTLNLFDNVGGEFDLEPNIVVSLFDYKIPMRLVKFCFGNLDYDIKQLQTQYGPSVLLTQQEFTSLYNYSSEFDMYAFYMSANYTNYTLPSNIQNLNNIQAGDIIDYPLVFLVAHCDCSYDFDNDIFRFREDHTNFRLLIPTNPFSHYPLQYHFSSNNSSPIYNGGE